LALALFLLAIFSVWIASAQSIYLAYFGDTPPESVGSFVQRVLTTEAGYRMILIGNFVGFLFGIAAFVISVVSFPVLIDRKISAIGSRYFDQVGAVQPADDGVVGPHRSRPPADRIAAALRWSTGSDPDAWPFDLAPLPQIGGAGIARCASHNRRNPRAGATQRIFPPCCS